MVEDVGEVVKVLHEEGGGLVHDEDFDGGEEVEIAVFVAVRVEWC